MILEPSVFLGPSIGRLVDSHNNPPLVLIWSLVLRSLITMLILLKPSFLFFCLIVFIRSVISLPENPASNVICTQILPPRDVSRYFGLLGLLRSASKITAPTLGVLVTSSYGESTAIKISILMTLLASMLTVYAFHKYKHHDAHNNINNHKGEETVTSINKTPYSEENRNTNHRILKQLLWTVTTYSFMVFFINNQLPVLLRNSGYSMVLLGVLVTASGSGGILAASYLSRKHRSKHTDTMNPLQATIVSVIVIALCFVALGFTFMLPSSIAPYVATFLFFCTGMFSAIESIRANVVVVQEFPDNAGEVTAKMGSFRSIAMLIAPSIAAIFISHMASMSLLFIVDGGVGLVILIGITIAHMYSSPLKH
ncbi:MFS transporter [Acidithiobacillus marinus]|uniref:MFS transporter n=1 Tax=Acidithiobacillus marinus TaxID=187490 RepID=UPI0015553C3A